MLHRLFMIQNIQTEDLVSILKSAGDLIRPHFRKASLRIDEKEDLSPVTEADLASHEKITAELARLYPGIPCLSEESDESVFRQRLDWDKYWLVDPLDGTKEFIKGNEGFCINLALVENKKPVMGLVHAPVSGITYIAEQGRGASLLSLDGNLSVMKTSKLNPDSPRIVRGSVEMSHKHEKILEMNPELQTVIRRGPLKYALIPEGNADIYLRFKPCMEWDTAAIQCVIEQAGGGLFTLDGKPVEYNRENLENPPIYSVGDTSYDWPTRIRKILDDMNS